MMQLTIRRGNPNPQRMQKRFWIQISQPLLLQKDQIERHSNSTPQWRIQRKLTWVTGSTVRARKGRVRELRSERLRRGEKKVEWLKLTRLWSVAVQATLFCGHFTVLKSLVQRRRRRRCFRLVSMPMTDFTQSPPLHPKASIWRILRMDPRFLIGRGGNIV